MLARPPKDGKSGRPPRHHIYAAETTGLLLIALLLLVLTIVRYWHNINWSAH